ncbi:MAG: hypothetical protein U5K79_07480 [Cyclobacteriaceae bacterium]|nr:hypothetical protein [Cyclobacteriaceae bacterium]
MNLLEFLGHFHPVLVHLPIGILCLFVIIGLLVPVQNAQKSIDILRIMLLVSAAAATLSAASGFLQGSSGEYDEQLLTRHQILGILVTIANWGCYIKLNRLLTLKLSYRRMVFSIVGVLLILTGHAGGSLTHGSDFLNPPPVADWFSVKFNCLQNHQYGFTG